MSGFSLEENTPAHPYSLVREVGNGFAFVSGVLPYDDDGRILHDPPGAVAAMLAGLERRLATAGFDLSSVMKTTVFFTDIAWRDEVNRAFHVAFAEPRPARSAVQVAALPGGAPIELEAIVFRAMTHRSTDAT